jgi:hypothetical protein
MADSAFWRDLAEKFLASPDFRADGHYVIGSGEPWRWQLAGVAADFIRASFEALASRAASETVGSNTQDLVTAWLEELRTGSYNFVFSNQASEVQPDGTEGPHYLMGSIHGVCRASATLCKKLEADAIQAEFKEKQRENPKNWSEFRRRVESFESVKEVVNEPPYRIPEAVVRKIIADMDGTKPEDVTWKRIGFEIAALGGPNRRHIEVVPSAPQGSPPAPDTKPGEQAEPTPAPAAPPEETIAAQLQRLRLECKWTIEKLAAKTGFDETTVKRHLSGRASPRLGNLTLYERAFAKALKREVVINKTPPKRPLPPCSI